MTVNFIYFYFIIYIKNNYTFILLNLINLLKNKYHDNN